MENDVRGKLPIVLKGDKNVRPSLRLQNRSRGIIFLWSLVLTIKLFVFLIKAYLARIAY
jgi:hypothetical protein